MALVLSRYYSEQALSLPASVTAKGLHKTITQQYITFKVFLLSSHASALGYQKTTENYTSEEIFKGQPRISLGDR